MLTLGTIRNAEANHSTSEAEATQEQQLKSSHKERKQSHSNGSHQNHAQANQDLDDQSIN